MAANTKPTHKKRKKSGGRKKGTPNRKTVERLKAIEALKVSGDDPIEFMLSDRRRALAAGLATSHLSCG
jgi:hypothetical protein